MSDPPPWLPSPILLSDCDGDWSEYLEAVYTRFCDDLLQRSVRFRGCRVSVRRIPETRGKGFGFWHCISEGGKEEDRFPDLERCKRIGWIRAIIDNADRTDDIDYWSNQRGRERCWLLWFREEFLVVLAERKDYYLLKTAYLTGSRKAQKLRKERDEFLKKKPTPPRKDGV